MPTQAQLQQANALRKANPSLSIKDSVSQVLSPPAPVAQANPPVTPPTPTATPPQTMQGVNGETFQVAPTNAQGISTPTQPTTPSAPTPTPAPVTTPAPTTTPPTPTAPVDETTTIKAKNEAQMALNKQKAELRQAERDKETGVQTAEALKVKQEAEAQLANNEGAILGTLRVGGIIPEAVKSSPYYKSAENTYKQIQNFRTMGQGQLATAISNGALMPGTNTYNELIKDPAMEARIKEARIYATPVNPNKFLENQSSQILSQNSKVAQAFDDGLLSLDEYNQMTNNPDVVSQAKLKQEKEQALNTFNKEWSDARDKAKKEFAGSAFLDSILSDIDKGYKSRADYLQGEVQIATGTLSDLKATSTALFNANINEYIAYRNGQIEVDKTKATNAMDIQQNQAEFDQKIAQQAQAMNDPATAIQSVMDEYKKLGIPFTSTVQSRLAEFQASRLSLPDFLTKMSKNIQQSDAYKAYQTKQAGTEWQSTNITRYNPSTGANESTPIFYRKKTDGSFEAVDLAGNKIDASSLGGGTTTNTPPKPTGNIVPVTVGDKTVRLDQSGANGFENAVNQLITAGTPLTVGQGARDQVATIKSMASQFKIPFNANNPAETAQKLRSAGHQVADPGKSNHETGMAIDVYSDNSMKSGPTTAQEKVLNSQGWYSAGIPGDAGHFEYRGAGNSTTPIQTYDPNKIKSFEAFNGTTFPSDYKTPDQQKQFRKEYDSWRASRPGLKIEKGNDITDIKLDTPTDGKLAVQTYASRMLDSVNNLMPLEKDYANLSLAEQLKQQYIPGILKSDDQKLIDANKKNFITAVLRKQSGASIAPSEFVGEEIKYFPQPGDSKSVIIAKQNARNAEIKAMLTEAGYDTEGNSLSKYYNPPVIIAEDTATPAKTDKITELKNNYFTQK